eukprot:symbB.v1.2.011126.t1/scaffold739.1/size166688/17
MLEAALSFANFGFIGPAGPSGLDIRRRQGLLGTMASMLCAEEAQAVGVALDYRKLDEIDPSTRKIVGDMNSEKAQKAIALIIDAKEKVDTLFRNYKEDVTVRWRPYLTPIPEMRTALEEIQELFDKDSKRDVERVSRLLLSARYKLNEAPSVDPRVTEYALIYSNSLLTTDSKEKVKYATYLKDFLQIADKLLLFLA